MGTIDDYDLYLTTTQPQYNAFILILPDGEQVQYTNTTTSNLGSYQAAHFVPTVGAAPAFYGSTITWNYPCNYNANGCWNLQLKNGTIEVFPEEGHLTSVRQAGVRAIIDRYGNALTIARDANGNKTLITSPNGRWVQFQNDGTRITQATDDMGRTVTYSYDVNTGTACNQPGTKVGLLCSVTDANGGVTKYTYDASNRMLTITDPLGHTQSSNTYDATSGRMTKQTLADGTSSYQFSYVLNGTVVTQTTITDPNGNIEQKSFDLTGFVTSVIYAKGTSIQQTYSFTRDPNSKLITAMTDPLGRQYSYVYGTNVFNGTNYPNGNLTSVTCSNCLAQSITTSMTYDPTFNQLTSVTDGLNHTWSIGYDSRGNATSITDPLTHQVTLGYNLNGQVASFTDAANDTVSFTYNYGDLATIADPLGNTTHRFTDDAGRVMSLTDALGNLTQLAYDNLDHVTQITDSNNGTTKFAYDLASNLSSVTDALTNKTSYGYDGRNRLTSRTDALLIADSYSYDATGNLTGHTDRKGNVINYTYDGLNRPSQVQYSIPGQHGPTLQISINYTWDLGNRVTQAVDSIAGTINRQYNGPDRLTQEVTPLGTVNYTYDNAGRRSTMQVVGQSQVSYTWDNANRLTAVAQSSQSVGLNYDNADRRTCLNLPNGVTATYGYDKDSRVTSLTYGTGGSCSSSPPPSNLGNLAYTYDSDGRRTATAGSLAAVTLPADVSGGNKTTYNADNEQTKFNNTRLSYDSNGNLTSDGTNSYTFDARNHLTAISGGATASFVYDGFGRRMKKTISGTTTQLLYDGLNPVQELNSSNGVTANLLTGLSIDEYFTRTDTATSTFLADALGSTIGLVTSNNGPIATNYTYQLFGATTVSGAANGNSYQFTGRENDGAGFYFYRARYYSQTYQRFVAQDPIGFRGGANLYAYATDDPMDVSDPLGLYSRTLCILASTGIGAAGGFLAGLYGVERLGEVAPEAVPQIGPWLIGLGAGAGFIAGYEICPPDDVPGQQACGRRHGGAS